MSTFNEKEEIAILLGHYKKAKDPSIARRSHCLMLYLDHYKPIEIAKILYSTESTIQRWIRAYKANGVGTVFPGYYNNQNAAKLTREQKEEIQELIKSDPFPSSFWSVGSLKEYLSGRFEIEYQSDRSYHAILSLSDYSYKLPDLFNIRRDEGKVTERIKEIKKQIALLLESSEWLVFSSDESRIEWVTLKRRKWLKKGEKTVIRERRENKRQNYIGFWNHRTGEDLLYRLDWQDQEHIIPVLEDLLKKYPTKKIAIIWDNAGFHRGKVIKDNLGEGNKLANLLLINLPPYAPDKNPQEHVWKYGKDTIGDQVFNRFSDLQECFETAIETRFFDFKF